MTMSADGAGVRVNGVSPGFTRTAALEAGIVPGAPNRDWPSRPTAMSRLVEPIEVAQARPFCSRLPAAAFGINLPVDAGYIAGASWTAYGACRMRRKPKRT